MSRGGGRGGGGGGGFSRGPRELPPGELQRTLYVGNLDKRVSEYHLMQLFQQFGDLERVQFMWHHHGELRGQPRGFVFVIFRTTAAAQLAAKEASGVELAGRKMVVRFAEEKDPNESLTVEFKSTSERRAAAVGARAGEMGTSVDSHRGRGGFRGGRGGRGGGRGGFGFQPFDKFAFVPAPIPSAGFSKSIDALARSAAAGGAAGAPAAAGSALLAALEKVRALEDKLAAIDEEQRAERREAQRRMMRVDDDQVAEDERRAARSSKQGGQGQSQAAQQEIDAEEEREEAEMRAMYGKGKPAAGGGSSSAAAAAAASSSKERERSTADQRGERGSSRSPARSGYVHPDRRRRSRSRSRERERSHRH